MLTLRHAAYSMPAHLASWGESAHGLMTVPCTQVKEHTAPGKMVATLQGVMDDETRPFVLKLFRMLILETEKHARGIAE